MPNSAPQRRTRLDRRTYLAALATGVVAGLAGCTAGDSGITSERLDSPNEADREIPDRWSEQTRLTPTDDSVSHFGSSVTLAADGRTALVSGTHHEA